MPFQAEDVAGPVPQLVSRSHHDVQSRFAGRMEKPMVSRVATSAFPQAIMLQIKETFDPILAQSFLSNVC